MKADKKIFHIVRQYLSAHLDVATLIPVSVRPIPLIIALVATRTCNFGAQFLYPNPPSFLVETYCLSGLLITRRAEGIQLRQLHGTRVARTSTTLPVQLILTLDWQLQRCFAFPFPTYYCLLVCVLFSCLPLLITLTARKASCRLTCRQVGSYLPTSQKELSLFTFATQLPTSLPPHRYRLKSDPPPPQPAFISLIRSC